MGDFIFKNIETEVNGTPSAIDALDLNVFPKDIDAEWIDAPKTDQIGQTSANFLILYPDGQKTERVANVIVKETNASKPATHVDEIYEQDVQITGTGTPNYLVKIQFKNGVYAQAIVDVNGNWTVNVPFEIQLLEGDCLIIENYSIDDEKIGTININVKP